MAGGNVMEFFLGLTTAEFLGPLGAAGAALEAFGLAAAGIAKGLEFTWDHTWEAIGKGAALQSLSAATGESVGHLAQFQHGLEAIGADTGNLAQLFMMTERGLSGINENGQRTDILFARLGLNFQKLRGEDTVSAITEIAGALNKLSPDAAAGAAEGIFGKFGAQSVLEIARQMQGFQEGMGKGALTADLMDKFAKTFQQVKADAGDIENDFLGLWVQVGGKLAPEMHKVFVEVDNGIRAMSEAFKDGQLADLVELSLIVGIEYAGSFLENLFGSDALWTGIWETMKGTWMVEFAVIENFFVQFAVTAKTLLDWVAESFGSKFGGEISQILDFMAKGVSTLNPIMAAALHATAGEIRANANGTADFTTLYNENNAAINNALGVAGPGNIAAQGAASIAEGIMAEARAILDAEKNATAADLPKLQALVAKLLAAANNVVLPAAEKTKGAEIAPLENHYKPEFTTLEHMGFIMNGRHGGDDLQERIARSAEQTAHATQGIKTAVAYLEIISRMPIGGVHLT